MRIQSTVKAFVIGTLLCMTTVSQCLAEGEPIRIGIIGPFTSRSSSDMGESIRGGARVFESDLNQIGGVLGRKIELVERDDQAKPEIGVAMAKDLIEKEKVVAVVGFANTGVSECEDSPHCQRSDRRKSDDTVYATSGAE